jgi:hypothetical protein
MTATTGIPSLATTLAEIDRLACTRHVHITFLSDTLPPAEAFRLTGFRLDPLYDEITYIDEVIEP